MTEPIGNNFVLQVFSSAEKRRKRELREKFNDPNFLPTRQEIIDAFKRDDYNQDSILRSFCREEEHRIFEMLSQEYLNSLADYFVERIKRIGEKKEKPLVILEVGAGNGRLSHFLRQKLEERAPGLTNVVATDSGEGNIKESFSVEKINHQEALDRYRPDIVIASWMPSTVDWTKDFRKYKEVIEYILIGEAEGDCCGDSWETWGRARYDNEKGDFSKDEPSYAKDGFKKKELRDLSDLQICHNDDIYTGEFLSSTFSFSRF